MLISWVGRYNVFMGSGSLEVSIFPGDEYVIFSPHVQVRIILFKYFKNLTSHKHKTQNPKPLNKSFVSRAGVSPSTNEEFPRITASTDVYTYIYIYIHEYIYIYICVRICYPHQGKTFGQMRGSWGRYHICIHTHTLGLEGLGFFQVKGLGCWSCPGTLILGTTHVNTTRFGCRISSLIPEHVLLILMYP